MIAFIAQLIIGVAALVVLTICVAIWALLIARMICDFRPSRAYKICGTFWAVLLWGSFSGLCGFGAYTVVAAALNTLLRML